MKKTRTTSDMLVNDCKRLTSGLEMFMTELDDNKQLTKRAVGALDNLQKAIGEALLRFLT